MWRVALLGLTACGRLAFDPTADARPADVAIDACASFGPWGTPQRIVNLATPGDDYGPALSSDGQTLVFTSTRTGSLGGQDLWVAFATGPLQFGAAMNLTAFNSTTEDYGATWVGTDELYFSSDISGQPRAYVASYANRSFGTPAVIPELMATDVKSPSVTGDGLEMIFTNSTATTLGRAVRGSRTDPWQVVETSMPQLDMGAACFASVSSDGLAVYFQSRATTPQRLYVSTRPNRSVSFGARTLIDLGGDGDDADAEISDDNLTLMFGSARSGGAGNTDLYFVQRTCL